jgi:hypothetical protein
MCDHTWEDGRMNGGSMIADTTFKQFVTEKGFNLSLLKFGSRKYRNLAKAFNEAKLKLEAEEETRECEKERARLKLNNRSATTDLSIIIAEQPNSGARFAGPSR